MDLARDPTPDAPAPPAMRIVRPLGEGGMGRVWLVERRLGAVTQRAVLKRPRFDGPDVEAVRVRYRALPAVAGVMRDRLATVRREILRQNPVHANAWRTFGAWLERFEQGSPEELAEKWAEFRRERAAARALAAEVEAALGAPLLPPK